MMHSTNHDRAIDLDELIAQENEERALWAEADSAFRADPEFAIEIAGAARVAAEQQGRIDAAEQAGLASADPAEVARTERSIAWRRWRKSSALAAAGTFDAL